MTILRAIGPPLKVEEILEFVPELSLSRELEQSPYHHLDTFEHTLEVVRGVEQELEEKRLGARTEAVHLEGLRLAALLHDVAKPVTRGELEGKVVFVAHDTLGAMLVRRICRRLELSAHLTDIASTLTALHLKIGFMENPRSDYPPERLARAAGPFGEELAVLSWADRLAAQGPRLTQEHIERHRKLCVEFLRVSRKLGPYPTPDYRELAEKLRFSRADAGYVASVLRLLRSRGVGEKESLAYVRGLL